MSKVTKDLCNQMLAEAGAFKPAPEDAPVRALCERLGYGAVMSSASKLWQQPDSDAAFAVGPCIQTLRDACQDSEGLYLKLFHGRNDPEEQPADWGFDGPVFGPFDWFHTTYSTDFRAGYDGDDSTIFQFEHTSGMAGMLHYNDCWYGDWSVYWSDQKPERWVEWDAAKAKLRPKALNDDPAWPFNKLIEGTPDQMRLAASGICPICAQQAKICNLAFRVRSGEHTVQQCPDCRNVVIL